MLCFLTLVASKDSSKQSSLLLVVAAGIVVITVAGLYRRLRRWRWRTSPFRSFAASATITTFGSFGSGPQLQPRRLCWTCWRRRRPETSRFGCLAALSLLLLLLFAWTAALLSCWPLFGRTGTTFTASLLAGTDALVFWLRLLLSLFGLTVSTVGKIHQAFDGTARRWWMRCHY